jgi:GTP-binding protein
MSYPRDVRFVAAAARTEQYPFTSLPEIAFVGRSNVGKSSLMNALIGKKRLARTSRTPGKTQMIHFYQVETRFILVDLPGYGYAQVPEAVRRSWGPMVEGYLEARETLRMVVFLLDIRRVPSVQDLRLKGWLQEKGITTSYVVTKVDKVSRGGRASQMGQIARELQLPVGELLPCSASTREGCNELWGFIVRALGESG